MDSRNEKENPLVSIIVITYNSARFVLETLESAKAQTYSNIELIVSDDASTDDTVEICRRWMGENKHRFARVELVTSGLNTGISANCNRGLKIAKGEWLKFVAGDDMLLEDFVSENVEYAANNNEAKIIFSDVTLVNKDGSEIGVRVHNRRYMQLPAHQQNIKLLTGLFLLHASSSFINSNVLEMLGGFDERYEMLEDFPLWLKATAADIKLSCTRKRLVKYRLHVHSVTQSGSGRPANDRYFKSILLFNAQIRKELLARKRFLFLIVFLIDRTIEDFLLKTRTEKPNLYPYYKHLRFLSPSYYRRLVLKYFA